ncbi:WD40 repeat domain-containing protein [Puniceicoccus vermicola]|uniref:WD40 repeat domain-containing protein n=1 Tax=Puniceicoccus vermicola TaxID=388746 RepID=A0A7X1AVB8_9BACT|nr:WD40 repeat domain-containing protein [Puniceicoccus vermicola]MBC2600686.1 WD40 repeat domain-containing protein [Puniceicoccus vermicola]
MKRSFLLSFLLSSTSLFGVKTDSHVFEGYPTLSDGELQGVAVHWDGGIGVGPSLDEGIRPPQGAVIWDLAQTEDGFLYIATGGPGAVYKMEIASGEMKKVLDPDEPLLRAIHVDADGNLYAGTSPEGRVYRVNADDGFPEIYADLESLYIWSIEDDPENEGALLIAAGAPGRIYRLPKDFAPGDEPEIVLDTNAVHVSTFAFSPDGTLYYATGPGGHLLRKRSGGKPETLVELGQGEVREIFPKDDGSVRIAVYRSDSSDTSSSSNSSDNDSDSASPDGLPSGIFDVGSDGFVEILLAGSDEKIFSATLLDNELLIGSDSRGRVYRFQDRFDWSLLAESEDGGEVSKIEAIDDKNAWVATSNPATIHRLSYDPTAKGVFISEVYDAGQKVRWGTLIPVGIQLDSIQWETRTGNRSRPDDSWSEWEALKEQKVASQPGRFFQYRANFETPEAVVRRIELFYQLPNEAPIFRRVEGIPLRLESLPMPPQAPPRSTLPQLFSQNDNDKSSPSMPQPFVIHEDSGWLSIVWEAVDPNDDELRYRVYLRRLDQEDWFLLAEDLKDPFFSLNIAGFDPGFYEPRIQASDRMSNPPNLAKTSETRGNLILIDNQPPTIIPPTPENPLQFTVSDNFSIISSVTFRLEGSESRALLPTDGIFDSKKKTFKLPEEAQEPGATLHIEAADARGNRAAWTGLVTAPEKTDSASDEEPKPESSPAS